MSVLEWLEKTPIGVLVRESRWGFQIVAATHILGLTLSVGTLLWFDLRLLGASMPRCPVSKVYRRLMPWMATGFVIMFSSGVVLFIGYATKAYGSFYFRLKVLAILTAAMNAFFYHRFTERGIAQWNEAERLPIPARLAGLISIVVWATAIIAGRMMSYTIF